MPPITPAQIARLRLQSLGIHPGLDLKTSLHVAQHHLAMQAQDWNASRWAIGSRLPGSRDADILAAYDRGEIVRSWPMRGTVHVVAAPDLKWMLDLMGVRALSGVQRRWEILGINESHLERAREVAIQLLKGSKRATREELQTALTDAGLDLGGQRAYHTVWYLCQTGTLVQGPTRDGEQELVLFDEWVPQPRRLDRQQSLHELGQRYLQAHGPATIEDLMHWSKLSKGDCRKAFDAHRDACIILKGESQEYWMLKTQWERFNADDPQVDAKSHVLAAFDEHLLGYANRDAVLDPQHATLVDPGRNGVFRWTLVMGSQVVATWKRTPRVRRIIVQIEPFVQRTLPDLTPVFQNYSTFMGTAIEIKDQA